MAEHSDSGAEDQPQPGTAANTMWGGRFAAGPDAIMAEINASIGFDRRFAAEDIAGSRAHAAMLAAQGIISATDGAAIDAGLTRILAEIESGEFAFSAALEDIHMNVEARLAELIGEPAGRLHTARSRNDQVATDFRLWLREEIDALQAGLRELRPGTGATIRMLSASSAIDRSSESDTTLCTLIPAASEISYCVMTGPF